MTHGDGFRPDLKGRSRRAFHRSAKVERFANPKALQNAAAIERVERRVAEVRKKARAHHEKMKPIWFHQEYKKLRQKYPLKAELSQANDPRNPLFAWSAWTSHNRALANRAEANVRKRCADRIRTIEGIEHRMVRKIARWRSRTR